MYENSSALAFFLAPALSLLMVAMAAFGSLHDVGKRYVVPTHGSFMLIPSLTIDPIPMVSHCSISFDSSLHGIAFVNLNGDN